MPPRTRAWILLGVGGAVAVVSVAVFVIAPRLPLDFGWYADRPVIDTPAAWYFLGLDPARRWAVVCGTVGLVAAGWAAGFLAGRQRT